jgi:alpha-tubulin suppressor-like RCC1 family protein
MTDTDEVLSNVLEAQDLANHSCAVTGDGSVWCWSHGTGGNSQGELGRGELGGSVQGNIANRVVTENGSPLSGIVALASDSGNCSAAATMCAIDDAGSVYCWGANPNGLLVQDSDNALPYAKPVMADADTPLQGVEQMVFGVDSGCIINDGTPSCWGVNRDGNLGNGSLDFSDYPTLPVLSLPGAVSQMGMGYNFACALVDTTPHCWGSLAAVGNGDDEESDPTCIGCVTHAVPVETAEGVIDDATDLIVGRLGACVLRASSELYCWGSEIPDASENPLYLAEPITPPGEMQEDIHLCFGANSMTFAGRTADNRIVRGGGSTPVMCP